MCHTKSLHGLEARPSFLLHQVEQFSAVLALLHRERQDKRARSICRQRISCHKAQLVKEQRKEGFILFRVYAEFPLLDVAAGEDAAHDGAAEIRMRCRHHCRIAHGGKDDR